MNQTINILNSYKTFFNINSKVHKKLYINIYLMIMNCLILNNKK